MTATKDEERQIDLSWTAPSNNGGAAITSYRIEVSEDGSAWRDLAAGTGSTDTTHSHTGLRAEATRLYRVSAINSAGTSKASNTATGTTAPAVVPESPTELTATQDEERQINLSWTAPSDNGGADITGYRIEVSVESSAWSDLVSDTGDTPTTHSHTGLRGETTRHYRVSAINSAGTGPPSNVVSGKTAPPTAPVALTELAATVDVERRINLSWTAPSDNGGADITGYRIEVSAEGSAWSDLVSDTGDTATTHSHTGLRAEATRHYRVSAINSAGTGPPSNVATGMTAPPTAPVAPTGLDATKDVERRIDLSWTMPSDDGGADITGYRIEVSLDGSAWSDLVSDIGDTATTHSHTGLRGETTRHYRVSAINSAGTGPTSNAATGMTAPATVPETPSGLTATQDMERRIDLSWTAPPDDGGADITGYRIEVSLDGSDWSDLVSDTGDTATTHSHTRLRGETTRQYRVSAINSAGTGPESNIATGMTAPPTAPVALTELAATVDVERRINLSWAQPTDDGGADITGYRIEVSADGSDWSDLIADTGVTDTTYSHTGLRGETTRHYRVSAINSAGTGPESNIATGMTSPATVPETPSGLTATQDMERRIDLSWTMPSDDGGADITGYHIEVSAEGSTWSDLIADTGVTATTYSHTGLRGETTRHYRVSAINSAGTGAASNVSIGITAPPTMPGAPTELTATTNWEKWIDLSWTTPADDGDADIIGFRIEVSDDGTAWSDLVSDTGATDTTYSHTGLPAETTRHYRVSAINSAGTGAASNVSVGITVLSTPASDRAALIALYNATNGAEWAISENWVSDAPIGTWYGVTTNLRGRVTELSLGGNRLSGEMPWELASLSYLEKLFLGGNQIGGEISPKLGNLAFLGNLTLESNRLSGEIPPELGSLAQLEFLRLGRNQLGGEIPLELGNLSYLQILSLSENQLSGEIPPELGNLSFVWSISLNNNQLNGGIPPEFGNLSFLRWLDLSQNRLSEEIPPELSKVPYLNNLNLSQNQLRGEIPPELGNFLYLEFLTLIDNQLSGDIPPKLGNLSYVRSLRVDSNQLTGCVPWELRSVGDIGWVGLPFCLDADEAPAGATTESDRATLVALYHATRGPNWKQNHGWLSGAPLGEWFGVVTDQNGRVTGLNLSDNRLIGEIPRELSNLSHLQSIILYNNQLSGDIPRELGSLSQLVFLSLGQNQLSGKVPRELGELSYLTILYLSQNQLSGTIPPQLGDLSYLRYLGIDGNEISGCVPIGLRQIQDIGFVNLPFCSGQGEMPENTRPTSDRATLIQLYNATDGPNWKQNDGWLSEAPIGEWFGVTTDHNGRVHVLNLSNNWLSSEIPSELERLSYLISLNLSQNRLSGGIPPELGNLIGLAELKLAQNQLSGKIPPELGNLYRLGRLDLRGNQLTGEIPPELGNLSKLVVLDLAQNRLSGKIPPELFSLSILWELSLYENRLSGEIPPQLGNLSKLAWLFLNHNRLSGEIPSELENLYKMERMNLDANDLTGRIPPGLGNLFKLEWLSLNDNRLSGDVPSKLGELANLARLRLGGSNRLVGCIPGVLRYVPHSDLDGVGLPPCEHTEITQVGEPATILSTPPRSLGLDRYYEKYLDAGGIAIVASSLVPDSALFRVRDIINEMLSHRPKLHAAMSSKGERVAIMAQGSAISNLPEYRDYSIYRDLRLEKGGLYDGNIPLIVASEENILCQKSNEHKRLDVFVHEFAHAVDHTEPIENFHIRLASAYNGAIEAGLWPATYASTSPGEYWAQAVGIWFGLGHELHLNKRSELLEYDPAVAALIQEVFGDAEITSSCIPLGPIQRPITGSIQGTVTGPEGEPVEGALIRVTDVKSNVIGGPEIKYYGTTASDGSFNISVSDDSYFLVVGYELMGDANCYFVGAYGPGGYTWDISKGTPIKVEGADVTGIEITLPNELSKLPVIWTGGSCP